MPTSPSPTHPSSRGGGPILRGFLSAITVVCGNILRVLGAITVRGSSPKPGPGTSSSFWGALLCWLVGRCAAPLPSTLWSTVLPVPPSSLFGFFPLLSACLVLDSVSSGLHSQSSLPRYSEQRTRDRTSAAQHTHHIARAQCPSSRSSDHVPHPPRPKQVPETQRPSTAPKPSGKPSHPLFSFGLWLPL